MARNKVVRSYAKKKRHVFITEGDKSQRVLQGDAPGQLVKSKCALCLQVRMLRLSHIAPKWAFQWMKREGGVISDMPSLGLRGKVDDGEKHYLLCGECEQKLGVSENYLSVICKGFPDAMLCYGVSLSAGPLLDGVNKTLLLHALLGVLYKGHLVKSNPWSNVSIPIEWVSALRDFLNGKETRHSLGVHLVAVRWLSLSVPDVNPKAIMIPEFKVGRRFLIFDLFMGGWSWTVILPKKPRKRTRTRSARRSIGKDFPKETFLAAGHPWRILQDDIMEHRYFQGDGNLDSKDHFDIEDDWDCPCGNSDVKFSECCKGRWVMFE